MRTCEESPSVAAIRFASQIHNTGLYMYGILAILGKYLQFLIRWSLYSPSNRLAGCRQAVRLCLFRCIRHRDTCHVRTAGAQGSIRMTGCWARFSCSIPRDGSDGFSTMCSISVLYESQFVLNVKRNFYRYVLCLTNVNVSTLSSGKRRSVVNGNTHLFPAGSPHEWCDTHALGLTSVHREPLNLFFSKPVRGHQHQFVL